MLIRLELLMNYSSHVSTALRALMKGVQANGEMDEGDLDDVVRHSRISYPMISATDGFIG